MISTRYVVPLCVLLVLALVPTVIHSYFDDRFDDGRRAAAVSERMAGYYSSPTGRNATWGRRRFGSDDWVERSYVKSGDEVKLTIVRSFDPKSVYHHPELAISDHTQFTDLATRRFASRPDVPVFILKPGAGGAASGLYALHYDNGFVEKPILFQLRLAGELLFSRRKPMTLFALDPVAPADADVEASGAAQVLFAAIDSFLAQPPRQAP